MNKIALSCALFLAAGFAFGREPVQLSNWRELPFELENHTVTLVTHDGKKVKGKLLQRGLTDFAMDVSATADEARYPRGRHAIRTMRSRRCMRRFVGRLSASSRMGRSSSR